MIKPPDFDAMFRELFSATAEDRSPRNCDHCSRLVPLGEGVVISPEEYRALYAKLFREDWVKLLAAGPFPAVAIANVDVMVARSGTGWLLCKKCTEHAFAHAELWATEEVHAEGPTSTRKWTENSAEAAE